MTDEQLDEIAGLLLLAPAVIHRKINRDVIKTALDEGQYDLAPHHVFILKILQDERALCMAEIGRQVTISKSQMTASTDTLIHMGLVERLPHGSDRRKNILRITHKGDAVISEIDRSIKQHINSRLVSLNRVDLQRLHQALQHLIEIHAKI